MADDFVQLHEDGHGKKVDCEVLTVGGNVVERQRVVPVAAHAAFDHGRKSSIGTSAVAISGSASALNGVYVRAALSNTDAVYLGNSDVTTDSSDSTDGLPIYPGEMVLLPVRDPSTVYARAASGTQKVFFWFA